jgi:membrane fusion protein (multidrug efflux system)
VKFKQIQTAIAQGAAFQPPPEAVTTIVAMQEQWPATLSAIGTLAAVQGVTVSADLPGIVERVLFESGQAVRAGQVLAVLDTRQEQAQLAAIEAQRELARLTFDRDAGTVERAGHLARRVRPRHRRLSPERRAGSVKCRRSIQRKTIRAPFSGILGIRQVNVGQYLSGGAALVTLQSLNPIYVNFGVPQQSVGQIPVGRDVHVRATTRGGQG